MIGEIIGTVLSGVDAILDKFIPDANVKEQIKAELTKQSFEWAKLDKEDRDSARKREVDTKDTTTRELAYIYTFGYFGLVAALFMGWINVPDAMKGMADALMGVLTAGQYSIMAYYFGSSHGSAQKDKVLDRVVNHRD